MDEFKRKDPIISPGKLKNATGNKKDQRRDILVLK
jgi:hypothetical protein